MALLVGAEEALDVVAAMVLTVLLLAVGLVVATLVTCQRTRRIVNGGISIISKAATEVARVGLFRVHAEGEHVIPACRFWVVKEVRHECRIRLIEDTLLTMLLMVVMTRSHAVVAILWHIYMRCQRDCPAIAATYASHVMCTACDSTGGWVGTYSRRAHVVQCSHYGP